MMMVRTLNALVAALLTSILLGGCNSTPTTATLDDAVQHYDAKRYSLARQEALSIRAAARADQRAQASYLAGLSAYNLGELDAARTDLKTALTAADSMTAGLANAQLGIIELDDNQPARAARYFETASSKLAGADARHAAQHAAMAHQLAGNYAKAQQWAQRSASIISDPSRRALTTTMSRYALQAGAFRSLARAERTARELEPIASNYRLGPVRVLPSPARRGDQLHLVQFGAFDNRSEANRARATLGRLEVIVVPSLQ